MSSHPPATAPAPAEICITLNSAVIASKCDAKKYLEEVDMENLSPIAEAIRHYKLNASGGYDEWSKVPRAPDYKMHVPYMDFNVTGHDEVREVIFGWLTDIGAQQELVDIVEFGGSVTCYLHITDKEGAVLDIVEVFQIDDQGRVSEIWAL